MSAAHASTGYRATLLTFLHGLVLRQLWHVFIQQISQGLSVGQQLLVGSGELFVLLVSVLAQLSFRVEDASEQKKPTNIKKRNTRWSSRRTKTN